MIMTVAQLKTYINTNVSDAILKDYLTSAELMIRAYTNNNFQNRGYRVRANISDNSIIVDNAPYAIGDTVQITESIYNQGIFTVESVDDSYFTVLEDVQDEDNILITKAVYPFNVVMGVVKMIDWNLNNGDKVGIQSESISRHSVTYFNMDGDNSVMGYPKSLLGFLRPYRKPKF